MNPYTTNDLRSLTESQRAALINLLVDEDPLVHQTVKNKILCFGNGVQDWLKEFSLDDNPIVRRRTQDILDDLAKIQFDTEFLGFCLSQGEEFDLEEGLWCLTRTEYPNSNISAYAALLDLFAANLKDKLIGFTTLNEILAIINSYLFSELNFHGNEENYYDPGNSYLNRVIDRRVGNPISLCLIYLLITRRLQLPITGIGLPGHFICRYQSPTDETYIDAFHGGKLLSKGDCVKYLLQTNHTTEEGYLKPVSSRRILLRICANLHSIYAQREDVDRTSRLQRYLVALAK
ncbi:MAG: uncharacterized protein JWN25_1524 [Verrucomicrobiales bacterium]|nr:uncharacterized protein [Verrucomicrobiales bacterium]